MVVGAIVQPPRCSGVDAESATPRRTVSSGRPGRRPRLRRAATWAIVAVVVLALPVPWRLQLGDAPMALAWRLDGRLEVNGQLLDPDGTWSWLTAGRPPLVAEVLADHANGGPRTSWNIRDGASTSRPAVVEPVAAAVGLSAAGRDVTVGVSIEVAAPIDSRYPQRATLTELNGVALTDRAAWAAASMLPGEPVTFRLSDGSEWRHDGRTIPFTSIDVVDLPPRDVEAVLFGDLPDIAPIQWVRDHLSLGPSHGLMVALTTWAAVVGTDLDGIHVAGTGGIRGDGLVTPIAGLEAKAAAARDSGAEIMFFPVPQAGELVDFEPGSMTLVGVASLDEAVAALDQLSASADSP